MPAETLAIVASYAESLLRFRGPLIESAVKAGYRVYALAPDMDTATRENIAALGAEPMDFALTRTGLNPVHDLQSLWQLARLLRRIKPGKVLCYTIKPVIYGSLAARISRVPQTYALVTGLGSTFMAKNGLTKLLLWIIKQMYKGALSTCAGVIFQNPDDRQFFVDNGLCAGDKSHVVNGSGVDIYHYRAVPLPDEPVFLLIGRLIKDKGVREYAKAAEMLATRMPAAKFLLVGWFDANPSAITEREVAAWQARGLLSFLGRSDDVREALSRCSIFVLPSYREGTPRTVLEAMAMGRPVITTDVPGCRETVSDGVNGFLVPRADAAALALAMEKLAQDSALRARMGEQGRRIAEEKYDVNKVNRAMFEIMQINA